MDKIPLIKIDKPPLDHDAFIKEIEEELKGFLGKPMNHATLMELIYLKHKVDAYNEAYDTHFVINGYEQLKYTLEQHLGMI